MACPLFLSQDRDVPLDQRVIRRPQFSDPEVCKHALAGLCPFGERPNLAAGWLAREEWFVATAAVSCCCRLGLLLPPAAARQLR